MTMLALSQFGLMTVSQAAALHECGVRAVQKWINAELLPAVMIGEGARSVFLLRIADVKKFTPPPRGRPKS